MKAYLAFLLLSHLSTQATLAAEVPTFTQKEPENYFGTNGNDVELGPNDIDVQVDGDFVITLGTEITSKISGVLNRDCKKPSSEACQQNLKDILGIGPGNDGLHKRVIGVDDAILAGALTWLAYSAYETLAYIWNDGFSKHFEGQGQWKIPKEQKEEIEKWNNNGGEFTFQPHEGDPIDVKLDSPPKEKPKDAPTLTKDNNGDLTITFPGHGGDLEQTFNKVLCKHDGKRSLTKRISMSCLVANARALLQQFQVGAALDGVYYLDPLTEFPKPKNELLIGAIADEEETLDKETYWFGAKEIEERKKKYATLSSWMAFGYTVGHISVQGDKFSFSKTFLDKQEDDDEEEKETCTEDPTFCSNCGGNAIADNLETLIGSCKGTTNGALKGCTCFVDQSEIDEDWNLGHFIAAYGWMDSLPAEGEDEDDDNDRPSTTCKPKALPNAFDGPNCDECNDSQPFSEKKAYKAVAREFCRGDWNFKAEIGSKDAQKWSATLDMFTDSVQTDPDTKLPPICAIGNQMWETVKTPDSAKRCLAKGSWSGNSEFRITVLPAEDQSGCKTLANYKLPTGDKCEEIFDAIVDDCIPGKKDDETGGYHLDKSSSGCWEWWIYSKKDINLKR